MKSIDFLVNEFLYLDNEFDMKFIDKNEYQKRRKESINKAKKIMKKDFLDFGSRVADRWGMTKVDTHYIEDEYEKFINEKGSMEINDWILNWTSYVTRNTQAEFDGITYEDGAEWFNLMWSSWLNNSDHGQKIKREKALINMMRLDEESGLYDTNHSESIKQNKRTSKKSDKKRKIKK